MFYPFLLIIGDFLALLGGFTVAYIWRVQFDTRPLVNEIPALTFIQAFLVILPFWLIIHSFIGLYTKEVYEYRLNELARVLVGSFLGMLLVIGADFASEETIFPARLIVLYAFAASFVLLALVRNILWILRKWMFRYGYGLRNVMIVGNTQATKDIAELFRDKITSGYNIRLITANKKFMPGTSSARHEPSLSKSLALIDELGIDSIIQTEFYEDEKRNSRILLAAREHHLSYRFIPAQTEFYSAKNEVEVFNGYPVVVVHQTPLVGWGRIAKRLFDLSGAIIGGIIISPFLLIVAIIIKITDPAGPLIYKHERITRFGTTFNVFKFRSMRWKYCPGPHNPLKTDIQIFKAMGREDLIDEYKKYHKVIDDPRITGIGKFIRATSIDEFPQLLNVIRGDLSLVGPRPMIKAELGDYKKKEGGNLVTSVKSGMTGLWQVSGRNDISFDERIEIDKYYVQNWSFWLDIKILLKTIIVVIRKTGAR